MADVLAELLPRAERIATRLARRGETLAVVESSAGGLISAALLGVAGASAWFQAGAVVYTKAARATLLGLAEADLAGIRPATEAYARLLAETARARFGTHWAVAETGATGPTGNRYGDPAGHGCAAVAGPAAASTAWQTGEAARVPNMQRFAAATLDLLEKALLRAG